MFLWVTVRSRIEKRKGETKCERNDVKKKVAKKENKEKK